MRNLTFFFWALLLVDGVFGVDVTVSVMEGDSVSLNPHTEIPEDTTVQWLFGDTRIAQINKTVVPEGKFRGKLKLDYQTGSLTITNITPEHAGLYKLQISGTTDTSKIFHVTVSDVVKSLSVMEGDSVTLHTGVTGIQRDDQILWKFGDQDLNGPDDTRWSNIEHRNKETGEITIRNIRTDQSGYYKLEINTRSMILHKKLHITISGQMKTISVKEGGSITIHTGLIEIQGYDLILWKFKEQLIAEINKGTNQFLTHDTSDKRFKGRLQMHHQSGSLLISDSRTTDIGVYHLKMSNSTHTVQSMISVTVSGVFGVEKVNVTVSAMEGDSVTLNPHTEIPEDTTVQWLFGDTRIAQINKTVVPEEKFRGKLKLDHQTGSLTITNITPDHDGLYKLQLSGTTDTSKIFRVTVSGKMKTVSVEEEEPIILYTGVIEIQGYDLILWKFEDQLIAEINKGTNQFLTHDSSDKRFKGRLQMHHQSGDLTIRGSRTTDSGDYHLNMNSSTHTLKRTISVTVSGVFGGVVTVSVMKGDYVTLKPQTEIPEDVSAQWWFGGDFIARVNKAAGLFSTSEGDNGRFKGKLNLDKQTGSLTITNIRTDHTGLYELKIKSTTVTSKIFRVTVSDVVKSLSVMEGDNVTLHIGVINKQRDDQIQWKFGDQVINTDRLNGADARWSNTDLNHQTRDLTIKNIQRNQSGDYEVEIKNKNSLILHRKFRITLVSDKQTPDPGLSSGVIAGIVVGVLLVFAAAVAGVFYHRWKISKLKRPKDDAVKNETNVPFNETVLVTANSDDL